MAAVSVYHQGETEKITRAKPKRNNKKINDEEIGFQSGGTAGNQGEQPETSRTPFFCSSFFSRKGRRAPTRANSRKPDGKTDGKEKICQILQPFKNLCTLPNGLNGEMVAAYYSLYCGAAVVSRSDRHTECVWPHTTVCTTELQL